MSKIKLLRYFITKMGWRYTLFRVWYEFARKSGLLARKFPVNPPFRTFISLEKWQEDAPEFFFASRSSLQFPKNPVPALKKEAQLLKEGKLRFFSAETIDLGVDYNWKLHPETGFQYDVQKHWTEIPDFSRETGDIKYVWEKSRFSYLHTMIRYDYHFEEDSSEWVLAQIMDWIKHNPINRGPNYRCSQEISLRVLNWTFALYYYKYSPALTDARFQEILNSIYWQLHHVRNNISFSRIAVRNNHAITETMMLYLSGLLFPFMPDSLKWSAEAAGWFAEEIEFQVFEDGTFIQYSHNYHRVLIQLLTWALYLSRVHKKSLPATVEEKAKRAANYLYQCQDQSTGFLPNYGTNDGALFFPLNNCVYRDYRPQINALHYYFHGSDLYPDGAWIEDRFWYTGDINYVPPAVTSVQPHARLVAFPKGGYYVLRDNKSLSFVRCGRHDFRPGQADNLHWDLWYNGKNILRDAGSYKYNTSTELTNFFFGSTSHNVAVLGDESQMQKGPRFVWYKWTQALHANLSETEDELCFEGSIKCFQHLDSDITHSRTLKKKKGQADWQVEDFIDHRTTHPVVQIWNISEEFEEAFMIESRDNQGEILMPTFRDAWYSSEYGHKIQSKQIIFTTPGKLIKTHIWKK